MGLTRQQKAFAAAYADGLDGVQAARKAGFSPSSGAAYKALQKPEVHAEIARVQNARLFEEILPLAVAAHIKLLSDPATPAGARVQAVKLAYDRTLGSDGAGTTKEPHEMTPEELQRALDDARIRAAALESVKADRANPVIDAEPVKPDIFD